MSLTLPIQTDPAFYTFSVDLDGASFGFELRWNAAASGWFIALLDADGNTLVASQRLVSDWGMFSRYPGTGLRGLIVGLDTTGAHADPGRYDLGTRFLLLYFTNAEVGP